MLVRFGSNPVDLSKFVVEFGVVIKEDVSVRVRFGECFPQLLNHPTRRGMRSNVAVQDFAPSVFDDQEAVQELERQRGYSEEIERHEHLSMIAEKRDPVLGAIAMAGT